MNDGGLATAIFAAMILIIAAGLLVGFLLSRTIARHFGWGGTKRTVTSLGLALIGIGGGILVVIATFYESTWAPPPQITFNAPAGFSHKWVILLEDKSAERQLAWQGIEVPFFGKKTAIDIPPQGIVRLRSLENLVGRMDINARWSDGLAATAQAGGMAPKSARAVSYRAFNRVQRGSSVEEEPPFGDDDAFGAYIITRERGAR